MLPIGCNFALQALDELSFQLLSYGTEKVIHVHAVATNQAHKDNTTLIKSAKMHVVASSMNVS